MALFPSLAHRFERLIEAGVAADYADLARLNKWQGRDHWARAMSIAFAGAGVPGGQIIGQTDREAADVTEQWYTPYDYAETLYHKLGIDTDQRLKMPDGRPIAFTEGGRPIVELFA